MSKPIDNPGLRGDVGVVPTPGGGVTFSNPESLSVSLSSPGDSGTIAEGLQLFYIPDGLPACVLHNVDQ